MQVPPRPESAQSREEEMPRLPLPPSHALVSCQTQTETSGKRPGEHSSREKDGVTLASPGTKGHTRPRSSCPPALLSLEFQSLWRDLSLPLSS